MKILHVIKRMGFGGVESMVFNIARSLAAEKHYLLTHINKRKERLDSSDIEYFNVDLNDETTVTAVIRQVEPDIILYQWWQDDTYLKLDTLLPSICRTYLKDCHLYTAIHAAAIKAPVMDNVKQYIAVSDFIFNFHDHIPANKKTVIKNAIPVEDYKPVFSREKETDVDCVHIVKVSRIFPERFAPDLLDILNRLKSKNWHFHIIGEKGPFYNELLEQIQSRNMHDLVTIHPDSENIPELLSRMDIYYNYNAHYCQEAWGCAVTEAMAAGLPVVSESRAGVLEQIIHNKTGFLCSSTDEFIMNLDNLISDKSLRKNIGMAACNHARKHFSLDRLKRDYYALFNAR